MDAAHLQQTFLATFNPATTKEAETHLNSQLCYQPGFVPALMQLITAAGIDPAIQQAAAVYFKNHVNRYWANLSTDAQKYLIPEDEKQLVRDNILELIVATPTKIKVNITVVLHRVLANDFPEKIGMDFVHKALSFLSSTDANTVHSGLLAIYVLTQRYEHKKDEERQPFYEIVPLLFPRLYEIAAHCQSMATQELSMLLRVVLKTFFAAIQYDLPKTLASDPSFVNWMTLCGAVAVTQISSDQQESENGPFRSYAWLCRKRAACILRQLIGRYGIPTIAAKEDKGFARIFVSHYAPAIVKLAYEQLFAHSQGMVLSPRCHKEFLDILEAAMNHAKTWGELKGHVDTLISNVIFPPLCHTVEDQELWDEDPYEYIRQKFDPMTDYVSPAKAADALLLEMVHKRKKTLMPVLGFCDRMLSAYNQQAPEQRNPHHKDGILHMIGLLADTINEKEDLKPMLEPMLVSHVVPEFDSPYPFLRARACWMLQHFSSIEYSSDKIFEPIMAKLVQCLDGGDLPVQVMAAIGIQHALAQPAARNVIQPHLAPLIGKVISLTNEAENDDLTHVLQDLVTTFGDELGHQAAMIGAQLTETFLKMVDYDPTNDEEANKAMTAMGILGAIQTLLSMFLEKPEFLGPLEQAVLPCVDAILRNNHIDFFEDALDIMALITFATKKISPEMWAFFPIIYQSFKTEAADFFSEMMPVLDNYVSFGKDVLLSHPDYIQALLDMCDSVLANADLGEVAQGKACQLLESILLNLRGQIHPFMQPLISILMKRYTTEINTNSFKVLLLEVTAETLYYDAAMSFQIMEGLQPGFTQTFFNMWFENLGRFKRVHDLTVIAASLCEVLSLSEAQLPPAVAAGVPHMLPALIKVMHDMPAAIKKRKDILEAEEEDSDEEEEDEDMEDDEEEEDGDEADDYLEKLDDEDDAESEDLDSDEDEDEDLEEDDYVVETPMDKENVFILIRDTFKGLRGRPKASFDALIAQLSPEQQQQLQAGFAKANIEEELRASLQHKDQGYQFTSTAVPNSFNF
eukprot:comp24295_c0_seq1/m.45545 comp24295_c0_seq1/g.45545  ORF comp24295_c0_seq1/g.45545 comp24295_c0_seq1/m.45545 type:complete len:1028 (-) comp24295_c0_seq1:18-3101(-)